MMPEDPISDVQIAMISLFDFYSKAIEAGFSEAQALELTKLFFVEGLRSSRDRTE